MNQIWQAKDEKISASRVLFKWNNVGPGFLAGRDSTRTTERRWWIDPPLAPEEKKHLERNKWIVSDSRTRKFTNPFAGHNNNGSYCSAIYHIQRKMGAKKWLLIGLPSGPKGGSRQAGRQGLQLKSARFGTSNKSTVSIRNKMHWTSRLWKTFREQGPRDSTVRVPTPFQKKPFFGITVKVSGLLVYCLYVDLFAVASLIVVLFW